MIIDTTPKCPRCGKNNAVVHIKYGVLPCETCIKDDRKVQKGRPPEFATQSQADRVRGERDKHARDIIQPWTNGMKINEEFVREYPNESKNYFTPEEIGKL